MHACPNQLTKLSFARATIVALFLSLNLDSWFYFRILSQPTYEPLGFSRHDRGTVFEPKFRLKPRVAMVGFVPAFLTLSNPSHHPTPNLVSVGRRHRDFNKMTHLIKRPSLYGTLRRQQQHCHPLESRNIHSHKLQTIPDFLGSTLPSTTTPLQQEDICSDGYFSEDDLVFFDMNSCSFLIKSYDHDEIED